MGSKLGSILSSLLLLLGCNSATKLEVGGLYADRDEDGTYSIMKILKLEDGGVHVRVYSNRYKEIPFQIDDQTLYLAGINHKPEEKLGMGHLPLSVESFKRMKVIYLKTVQVEESELDGYNLWKEEGGGFF